MVAPLSGRIVLLFFCSIQFVTYFDRGVMSGLLTSAADKWTLNGVQQGGLGTAYFIAVMVGAPTVAASLVGASGRLQMYGICLGSLLWAVAAACCGAAPSYALLLAARACTGFGEAFYCVLASPIIDDSAPAGCQARYQGLFYSLVYVATGIGFVAPSFSKDWDTASIMFYVEFGLMLPLILFGIVCANRFERAEAPELQIGKPDIQNTHASSVSSVYSGISVERTQRAFENAMNQTWRVLSEPKYFMFFMGYCALIFSLNGWNFWGPAYMQEVLHLDKAQGSIQLGAVVVFAGLAGSAVGGLALDYTTGRMEGDSRRLVASARVCFLSAILSLPFGIATVLCTNSWVFLCFATLYIFFLAMSTAPSIVGMMETCDSDSRGIAMGLASFGSHVFGDVLSPLLVGLLKDKFGSLVPGMWLLVFWGLLTVLFWGLPNCMTNPSEAVNVRPDMQGLAMAVDPQSFSDPMVRRKTLAPQACEQSFPDLTVRRSSSPCCL